MNPEKYLELFKKFINGKIETGGIIMTPISINEDYIIHFSFENPNNVSFTRTALKGWSQEKIINFNITTGMRDYPAISTVDCEELYINKILYKKISKYLKSVKILNLNNPPLFIKIEPQYFEIHSIEDDKFLIQNFVKPIPDYQTSKNEIDLIENLGFYIKNQRVNKYDETELSYIGIDEIITSEDPSGVLVDSDYMVQYVVTEFII